MDFPRRTLIALLLCASTAAAAGSLQQKADEAVERKEMFVAGQDGWRFLPAELRFAAKLAAPDLAAQTEPAMEAITDFAAQMKEADIQLVVMPVPPKVLLAGTAAGVSAEELQKMRAGWETIMRDLADRDVTVVDLLPDFTKAQHEPFCRRDTHWSGRGIALAVDRLQPKLVEAGLAATGAAVAGDTWTKQTIKGDLGGEPEEIELNMQRLEADPVAMRNSPVLLLGDSHVLVFHHGGDLHTTGAGLPDQLGAVLGSMPDVLGVRGSGATPARNTLRRRAKADESYLPSKKIIVWCFAGREFTEADDWRKIPIAKKAAAD